MDDSVILKRIEDLAINNQQLQRDLNESYEAELKLQDKVKDLENELVEAKQEIKKLKNALSNESKEGSFFWALQMMIVGKKVRRECWFKSSHVYIKQNDDDEVEFWWDDGELFRFTGLILVADDWELFQEDSEC